MPSWRSWRGRGMSGAMKTKDTFWVLLAFLCGMLAACAAPPEAMLSTEGFTLTPSATATVTRTQVPLPTLGPTRTPSPTNPPMATQIPISEMGGDPVAIGTSYVSSGQPITADNVDQLELLASWGSGNPLSVAFSPDGGMIAVGTASGLAMYTAPDMDERLFFIPFEFNVSDVKFSPDEKFLALGGSLNYQYHVFILELSSQAIVQIFEVDYSWPGANFEFSPDARYFGFVRPKKTMANTSEFILMRVSDWAQVYEASNTRIFAFSPNGKMISLANGEIGNLYGFSETDGVGERVAAGFPGATIFSADGSRVIQNLGNSIKIYDAATSELQFVIPPLDPPEPELSPIYCGSDFFGADYPDIQPPQVLEIMLTDQENVIAVVYNNGAFYPYLTNFIDIRDGSLVNQFFSAWTEDISISTTEPLLAALVPNEGGLQIWRTEDWSQVNSRPFYTIQPGEIEFSSDGQWILIPYLDSYRIRNTRTGEELLSSHFPIAMSPTGDKYATQNSQGEILIQRVGDSIEERIGQVGENVRGLEFSGDGTQLVSTTWDCVTSIWNTESGLEIDLLPHPEGEMIEGTENRIKTIQFSARPNIVFFSDQDGGQYYWDLNDLSLNSYIPDGENCKTWNDYDMDYSFRIVVHPGLDLLATAAGSTVCLFTHSGQEALGDISVGPVDQGSLIGEMAFSATGDLLATEVSDGSIVIFDLSTGQPALRFTTDVEIGSSGILNMAFSSDDSLLVASMADGTIRVWGIP